MTQAIYRGMDRDTLDMAYNNTKAVADFAGVLADFQARSRKLYEAVPCQRDLRYGGRPRQRYDWIPCDRPDAPTFVFIHGGYWQNCVKEDFAFVASGPIARGYNVALAEYTLAPEASMTEIVAEIGLLLDHLAADRAGAGIAGRPLCLSGHSAGGHLSAIYRAHPAVSKVLAISALVDLEPISLCWLDEKLKLSAREINDYSPLRHIGHGAPMVLAVGANELAELVRHSTDYALACEAAREPVGLVHVPGCTHFSMLDDLARHDGWQMSVLGAPD
ncbi:alpha/beta hydrolase [Paraburkholderia sp. B3]|uniref:alpha/beta hydrolase n=1 Tax=Paraburkholderia sp. B3 TaxID=3134791 RepID=UPI0039822E90